MDICFNLKILIEMDKASTIIKYHINAPREEIYKALIDGEALQKWRVPNIMTSHIHHFDGRVGGSFRISLTYHNHSEKGKTTEHTDSYTGQFIELIPNEKVVEVDEFETADPDLLGKMTITITLKDSKRGTDLLAVHDGLPKGVSSSANEIGWKEALAKLKSLVEGKKSKIE
jgi:uncharacterized protein YndB with AHSA1/START domain